MSESPYERVKGGRLTFKGGTLASRSKSIQKKNKKSTKKAKSKYQSGDPVEEEENPNLVEQTTSAATTTNPAASAGVEAGEVIYTIDAAKKMKYEDLFPVEARKFGYDPKAKSKSVEDALDDRVKKKADRYCK
ncbi:hypothetical protein Dimus_026959 [Dionaea muscipula]